MRGGPDGDRAPPQQERLRWVSVAVSFEPGEDRSLEVTWGGDCSEWLGRGPTQVRTTPNLEFRAVLSEGHVEFGVAL
jgi:hypothetical protein